MFAYLRFGFHRKKSIVFEEGDRRVVTRCFEGEYAHARKGYLVKSCMDGGLSAYVWVVGEEGLEEAEERERNSTAAIMAPTRTINDNTGRALNHATAKTTPQSTSDIMNVKVPTARFAIAQRNGRTMANMGMMEKNIPHPNSIRINPPTRISHILIAFPVASDWNISSKVFFPMYTDVSDVLSPESFRIEPSFASSASMLTSVPLGRYEYEKRTSPIGNSEAAEVNGAPDADLETYTLLPCTVFGSVNRSC